jgi:hypothetical protein
LDKDDRLLYDTSEADPNRSVDFTLKFAKSKVNKPLKKKRVNLVGIKIALDPGRLGGAYARLEERYIDIPPSIERTESIQFDEGTPSFLTANYLKVPLSKRGGALS